MSHRFRTLATMIPLSALALTTLGCADDGVETGDEQYIAAANPWEEADAFVKASLVWVELPSGGACSGVIVGPRTVLTAEHCVDVGNPDDYAVRFADGTEETLEVECQAERRSPREVIRAYDSRRRRRLLYDQGVKLRISALVKYIPDG